MAIETIDQFAFAKNSVPRVSVDDAFDIRVLPTKTNSKKMKRGNKPVRFPFRVHTMLTKCEENGLDSIVSWLPGGTSFKVHDQDRFVNEVLPIFFEGQTKYKSFQR